MPFPAFKKVLDRLNEMLRSDWRRALQIRQRIRFSE